MKSIIFTLLFLFFETKIFAQTKRIFFLWGQCELPFNPIHEKIYIDRSAFFCFRGNAYADALYIPDVTLGTSERIHPKGSFHLGSKHAFFFEGYYERLSVRRGTDLPFEKGSFFNDTIIYQYGNPSTDHMRILLGQQRPTFGINNIPDITFNKYIDPRYMWGLSRPGVTLILDSQRQSELDISWMPVNDPHPQYKKLKNHLVSARYMHDFSLAGSTRVVFSLFLDKVGEKRMGIGLLNISPRNNKFQGEWIRIYYPSKNINLVAASIGSKINSNYVQLIRFAYEDPPDKKVRASILYDDVSFAYRLFIIGGSVNLPFHSIFRFSIGYRQDLTEKHRNRFFLGTGVGIKL